MGEGRAQLGKSAASRPVDFARAVARLGVARGIFAFQRYGYLERNGQSNLAVPLSRWQVEPQPQQELLNDLDHSAWLERLQRAARDKFVSNAFAIAHRNLESAIMAICAYGNAPAAWQSLLLALTAIEEQLVCSHAFTAKQRLRPIPRLSVGWLSAADDGSAEFRLAVALALQSADEQDSDSVRHHWMPLDKFGQAFATDSGGLRKDPRVVCHGLEPERDLLALVQRRSIEGSHGASSRLALVGVPRFCAQPADLAALLFGDVDLRKTTQLARALMALDRRHLNTAPRLSVPSSIAAPPPLYGLFRLACLPWPLHIGQAKFSIRCDPAIVTRLAADELAVAGDLALRRLKASGLDPVIRHIAGDAALARRIALSLAFPISPNTATRFAKELIKSQPQSNPS
jgi:CRISPR-associated protein Csx17